MIFMGENGQLFGWSELTWLWLDQAGILSGVVLTVAGIGLAFWKRKHIWRWVTGRHFRKAGHQIENRAGQWEALVFTISHYDLPSRIIHILQPKMIALVSTREVLDDSRSLIEEARQAGIDALEPVILNDPDNIEESRSQVRHLLNLLLDKGYRHVAVDITGGKKPTSIGAFMAAEEAGAGTLYATAPYDTSLRKPALDKLQLRAISLPVND